MWTAILGKLSVFCRRFRNPHDDPKQEGLKAKLRSLIFNKDAIESGIKSSKNNKIIAAVAILPGHVKAVRLASVTDHDTDPLRRWRPHPCSGRVRSRPGRLDEPSTIGTRAGCRRTEVILGRLLLMLPTGSATDRGKEWNTIEPVGASGDVIPSPVS
jgi:hypothetical protein